MRIESSRIIYAENPAQMQKIAAELAKTVKIGDCFALIGDLGAGKTCFAGGFINSFQTQPTPVLSPTFNLVHTYKINQAAQPDLLNNEVAHFDLYRLKSAQELENIGFFYALQNSITLIEWPQIASEFLAENLVKIEISILNQSQKITDFQSSTRKITITDGR